MPKLAAVAQLLQNQRKAKGEKPSIKTLARQEWPELVENITRQAEISGEILEISMLTPVGQAQMEAKFLADGTVPAYTYNVELLKKVVDLRRELDVLGNAAEKMYPMTRAEGFLLRLHKKALDRDVLKTKLAASVLAKDDRRTAEVLKELYGKLDVALIGEAKQRLMVREDWPKVLPKAVLDAMTIGQLKDMKFEAKAIRAAWEWLCGQFDILSEIRIEITDAVKAVNIEMRPLTHDSFAQISPTREMSGKELPQISEHEFAGHALQAMNRGVLTLDMGNGSHNEGRTTLIEQDFREKFYGESESDGNTNRYYYVLAIERALKGMGFAQIFAELDEIRKGEKRKETVQVVGRATRGLTDMSNPYGLAWTKAQDYLRGNIFASELREFGLEYLLAAGIADEETMLNITAEFDWNEGVGVLPYEPVAVGERLLQQYILR